jgi:hypothetical protein
MSVKRNTLKKFFFKRAGILFSMERIHRWGRSTVRVSLSRRVARGLAHELISYGQNHKMMSHFGISATGTSKDKGLLSSTAFRNPETRNAKNCISPRSHFISFRLPGLQRTKGFSSTAFRNPETRNVKKHPGAISFRLPDFKGQRVALFHCISKPRNAKCEKAPRSHFDISATGTSKDKGVALFHCISKTPETRNAKKHPGAISAFRLPGLQRTRGLSLCFQSRPPSMEEAVNEY